MKQTWAFLLWESIYNYPVSHGQFRLPVFPTMPHFCLSLSCWGASQWLSSLLWYQPIPHIRTVVPANASLSSLTNLIWNISYFASQLSFKKNDCFPIFYLTSSSLLNFFLFWPPLFPSSPSFEFNLVFYRILWTCLCETLVTRYIIAGQKNVPSVQRLHHPTLCWPSPFM